MTGHHRPSAWIAYRKPQPAPRLRLLCLPYAGGGASIFRTWQSALPESVEVWPVQLPGRESRFREPPLRRLGPLVDAFLDDVGPSLGELPYALFGHSMGALLAYEIAQELVARGAARPARVVVSGRRAPHLPSLHEPLHALPQEEFRAELRGLNGTPEAVLDHPELMELLEPLLRADFELLETHEHRPRPPLPLPIDAYGGDADPDVPGEDVAAWAQHTSAAFRVRILAGDHFFLHHAGGDEMRREIAAALATA